MSALCWVMLGECVETYLYGHPDTYEAAARPGHVRAMPDISMSVHERCRRPSKRLVSHDTSEAASKVHGHDAHLFCVCDIAD